MFDKRVFLSGREGMVASAVMLDPRRCVGTIWSSKGEMIVLGNYLLVPNCLNNGHTDCEFSQKDERRDDFKLTLWEDDVQQDIGLPRWREQNEISDMSVEV